MCFQCMFSSCFLHISVCLIVFYCALVNLVVVVVLNPSDSPAHSLVNNAQDWWRKTIRASNWLPLLSVTLSRRRDGELWKKVRKIIREWRPSWLRLQQLGESEDGEEPREEAQTSDEPRIFGPRSFPRPPPHTLRGLWSRSVGLWFTSGRYGC